MIRTAKGILSMTTLQPSETEDLPLFESWQSQSLLRTRLFVVAND